jgi:hypothetical protein
MRIEQTRKLFSIGVLPTPQPTQDIAGLQERRVPDRLRTRRSSTQPTAVRNEPRNAMGRYPIH